MKKLVSIIIALALTLSSCMAEAQELTGEWYASVFGIAVTLVVNEDGTCSMLTPGEEPSEGAWVVEGDQFIINKGLEDETIATIGDGIITMGDEEFSMDFSREPISATEAAAAIAAESITDFDGTYEASLIVIPMDGQKMVIDMASAMAEGLGDLLGVEEDLSLVIQNGSASVFGEDTQTFTFADGKLNIPSPDAETPALEQVIELLEDGTVAYTLMGFQIVFTAAEAAGE